jgi:hypothetical protein
MLTHLFAGWLAVQFMVVGLTPAWGAVLPHTHVIRGPVTAAEWQAHLEQHRNGFSFPAPGFCRSTLPAGGKQIFGSVPDSSTAFSLTSLLGACLPQAQSEFNPMELHESLTRSELDALTEMFYPPPELPPNS